ncbi:retrotransposon protein, putative, ty1-copia subclass [Tanacetum coccineum]
MVRSMMNLTTLPLSFWYYALETATRILNMVPTNKVNKTPYELWYIKVPNLSYLKVWGYEAPVKRDMPDKLQQRYVKCIFVGYPKEMMGYYFYFPLENKIFVARYAEFLEKNLLSQKISGRAKELEEIQDEDTSPSKNTSKIPMKVKGFEPPQEEVVPIRKFARTHQDPDRLCLNVEVEEHSLGILMNPLTIKESKYAEIKREEVIKEKETFSPVADIRVIRILIAIATFYDYEIWKMDVKIAFLNGYLDEDIYMVQPKGFIDPDHPRKVGKLQRSIYGLKQASKSWNKRFDEEIKRKSYSKFTKCKDISWKVFCHLGKALFILGIKIYQDRSKRLIELSQSAYMDKILKRYRMDNSKRGYIPINTKDMFLVYGGNPKAELRVDYYSDVGFETDRDDTKSQTEPEYIAASEAGIEAV